MAWTALLHSSRASAELLLEAREAESKISPFVDSGHQLVTAIMGFLRLVTHHDTDSGTLLGKGLERKEVEGLGSHSRLPGSRQQPSG